ncbi:hypothetical protein Q0M94_25840 (plasmid) [Deinococcus radiomollis]|uniref:hypothetical protein n=1 Tax=Deinococcus radiomollis TaxID=468916 RepID=UPI0038915696
MKNLKWISAALALTLGIVGAGTLASAQHNPASPVTQSQSVNTDLPEANDVTDAVDSPEAGDVADTTADRPEAGDVADSTVDRPEAGDVADQAGAGVTDTPEAGDTADAPATSGK